MSEIERLTDQLKRAFEGDAWHGPSVREVLLGINPEMAARRVIPETHTVWEIVLHIGVWENFVRRRLEGESIKGPIGKDDWPDVLDTTPVAWQKTVEDLVQGHLALRQALSKFPNEKLDETVPGTNFPFYVLLHGVVQHDLYHAGQIVVLKKGKA